MLAVKHCQFFQTAALEIFDRFQIFFQFIGNGSLGRTLAVLFVGFPNIPDNEIEVIKNHVAEIFIIADMGGLQHFQMRVVFAGAIPFNDFMPDSIDKGVEVLNLHGGNPIYINLNVRKKLDKVLMSGKLTEQTVVNEAIISRELFAAVQKALDQAAQQAKDREIHSWSPNLLRGKIFCAHCGHSLHRQKCVRRKSQEVYVYHCISNNRIKKGVCPGVFIFEKELLDALADVIQEQLDTTLGQYSLGLENLSKEAEEQKNIQAKIASRKQEIQQLRTYQRGLYEGLIQNHLSKDEYFSFKEKYEAKIEAISEEIEQLKAGLAILAKQLEQYKMLSQDAQHIKEDRQLTAALIDRLIDRIEVSREKRITVRFRFQSEFEHCEEVLSQCRNM